MTLRPASLQDPIAAAEARFRALATYDVTLESIPNTGETVEVRYYYRKPGFIRVDFIRPHAGASLVYNPLTRKVLLWPFGFHTFPSLTFNPGSPMVRGPQGHRVDQSDVGALLKNVQALQGGGDTRILGADRVGARRAEHVVIVGAAQRAVAGVHRYELWLDEMTGLPIKVVSANERNEVIETVLMDDLEIDVPFPDAFWGP